GEIEAQQIVCEPFNKKRFRAVLKNARALTTESPDVFLPTLIKECASAGVAVVFVPELPKTRVSGCTRWLGNKAVIQLSLRYKSNDHLWFTFFHEAGHILKHGRKEIFIEGNGMDDEKEKEADVFARNYLIPRADYRRFLREWDGRKLGPVEAFAKEIDIAPGIVVGRLQRDKKLTFRQGNGLKVFWEWA
ncbi:ImmA/IrrE family metallo-endopeptidase, partial [Myxococcota bacterium]|nr:ImmA/IrrE family metallo-endopeptidase [Myxococcota bacterium]